MVLPIPFGNLLPALALILTGLGLVFGGGIAVILGRLMSGVARVATIGLFLMTGLWGSKWTLGWV